MNNQLINNLSLLLNYNRDKIDLISLDKQNPNKQKVQNKKLINYCINLRINKCNKIKGNNYNKNMIL